jgi:hypothetical protein
MEFLTNVTIAAVHSGGLVNDAMIHNLPTQARKMEDNTTIARMDTRPLRPRSGQRPPPADLPKLRPTTPLSVRRRHRQRMNRAIELLA